MADLSDSHINVAALKRVDPYLNSIVDTATHVALYTFSTVKNEWEKTDIEGALFVYRRTGQPFHGILIMNRLNTNNLVEPVTKDLDLQPQEPFLLYKNSRGKIFGIWFYDKVECVRISNLLQRIVKESDNKIVNEKVGPGQEQSAVKKGVDIFGMLSRAQEDYNMNKVPGGSGGPENRPRPPQGPDGTSQSVMDFFAKAKGQQKDIKTAPRQQQLQQQPVATPSMFVTQRPMAPLHDAQETQMKPFMQRLMSNPAHSVEHIEKQQRAVTPQEIQNQLKQEPPTAMTGIHNKQQPNKFVIQPSKVDHTEGSWGPPKFLSGTSHDTRSVAVRPTQVTSNNSSVSQPVGTSELRPLSAPAVEMPKKPALMLPSMFTCSTPKEEKATLGSRSEGGQSKGKQEEQEHIQPEPLNRNQLYQAFNYLLKNDPEFVNKLHEAYVKSFSEMIS